MRNHVWEPKPCSCDQRRLSLGVRLVHVSPMLEQPVDLGVVSKPDDIVHGLCADTVVKRQPHGISQPHNLPESPLQATLRSLYDVGQICFAAAPRWPRTLPSTLSSAGFSLLGGCLVRLATQRDPWGLLVAPCLAQASQSQGLRSAGSWTLYRGSAFEGPPTTPRGSLDAAMCCLHAARAPFLCQYAALLTPHSDGHQIVLHWIAVKATVSRTKASRLEEPLSRRGLHGVVCATVRTQATHARAASFERASRLACTARRVIESKRKSLFAHHHPIITNMQAQPNTVHAAPRL